MKRGFAIVTELQDSTGEHCIRHAVSELEERPAPAGCPVGLRESAQPCRRKRGFRRNHIGTFEDFLRSVHPNDRYIVEKAIADAKLSRHLYAVEFRVVWPDATIRWAAAKGKCYYAMNATHSAFSAWR
jgi:hypothetical protein